MPAKMFKLILFLLFLVFLVQSQASFHDGCGREGPDAVPLVLGGYYPEPHEFPWHVAIFKWDYTNRQYRVDCGGSLIRSNLVISAAHCFVDVNLNLDMDNRWVVAGSQLAAWYSQDPHRQKSKVFSVRLGPEFIGDEGNYEDDIAIVQLTNSFTPADRVRTVCLQLRMDMDNWYEQRGLTGKVAGWGLTEWQVPSDTLKFMIPRLVGDRLCSYLVPDNFQRFLIPDKVCAGLAHGSSMCKGDSGGGLVVQVNGIWYLRGVLSIAPGPQNQYEPCYKTTVTLYTNVLKHSSWLIQNLRDLNPALTQ